MKPRRRVCVLALAVVFAVAYGRPLLLALEAAGSLLVESDPAGASVYVDGRLAGQNTADTAEPSLPVSIASGWCGSGFWSAQPVGDDQGRRPRACGRD